MGWAANKGYTDPFASDKPKFVITKANMAQYREHPPGAIALLEKNDAFKMPVYETRRTACYPDAVYQEVKAKSPALDLQGFGITGGRAVPFPIPKSGLEVMWNHQQRYLGGGLDRRVPQLPGARERRLLPDRRPRVPHLQRDLDQPQDNLLLVFRSGFTAPATLEARCSWCRSRSTR